uniref:NADH-ubiquinone oxidoreductase chain 2 n=1 Tax=Monolepta hieroglyphica TaxID=327932 RepID=A0A891T7I2_9CUCU|nr:NADH dehydrogenase subunit 2 [Monolepta quadriguttata]YP_010164559.1 NADH dehydrogenase subunit 2 [Monolepta hieroglyphica]AST14978.1 NADH dehydrogenase subunit 2 [Monolepta quadriguttata]QRM91322.1 NADH dehydrogenase subunit 2 [Monolepta hieroglyphica]QTH79275.1 NADH dehydrogenase subunit 2 [Monolepta hieroglyphica]QUA05764.1 NADH dehydrogenase subunit 2 [Monolepta hieroglyphica]UFP05633.1 NADH dehydrogenase subunit 2 [Monolepta hieroglyphica]
MFMFYKLFFFNTLMIGTLISISANSWFSMWIGLEINLLSMIPLMKSHLNKFPAEASLKYFITQSLASTMILFSLIMMLSFSEFIYSNLEISYMLILNSALLTKLGAAPFHAWFPEVIEGLNWMNSLILLTWQKIAPMILIMYNFKMSLFFSSIIIISSIIGGIYGINQISMRKIMAFSSINHIAWMLASMMNMKTIWFSYFIIYSLISLSIILICQMLNIFYLNQMFLTLNSNKLMKMFFIMNFMSLGGLPPFLGFLPKWLTMMNLINNNFYFLSFILIVFSLITLFFYIRITLSTLTVSSSETIMKISIINNYFLIFMNLVTLLSLILCTSILNIL